jgi:hypothetical protein
VRQPDRLQLSDFIDYFAGEPELRVILCYIEAVLTPPLSMRPGGHAPTARLSSP